LRAGHAADLFDMWFTASAAAPGQVSMTQGFIYFVMSGSDQLYQLAVN
jgi:hypothetical protein